MHNQIYLSIGTNLGDRLLNLLSAVVLLQEKTEIKAVSGIYRTEPVGYLEQPDFYNLVLHAETELSPHELLRFVKSIENQMGRQKTIRFGPRNIDIDILYYNDLLLETEDLIIPHARMHERRFVLVPLSELSTVPLHPLRHQTPIELLEHCPQSQGHSGI